MILGKQIPGDCVVRELLNAPVPYDHSDLQCAEGGTSKLRYRIAPSDGGGLAVVAFHNCHAPHLGSPNGEALSGHRFAQCGLQRYAFQEVFSSDWIADLELRNRVHPKHFSAICDGLRHFIVSFQDVTFECIARSFTWTREEVRSQ